MKIGLDNAPACPAETYSRDLARVLKRQMPQHEYVVDGKSAKEVDLYHCSHCGMPFAVRLLRVKSVVTVPNLHFLRYPHLYSLPERLFVLASRRRALRAAGRLITFSTPAREELSARLKIDPGRIEVVMPLAARVPAAPPAGEELSAVRRKYSLPRRFVLMLGTVEPRHNHETLLDALLALDGANRGGEDRDADLPNAAADTPAPNSAADTPAPKEAPTADPEADPSPDPGLIRPAPDTVVSPVAARPSRDRAAASLSPDCPAPSPDAADATASLFPDSAAGAAAPSPSRNQAAADADAPSSEEPVGVVICGRRTAYADFLLNYARRRHLAGRVEFIYELSPGDLPALFRLAHLFVYLPDAAAEASIVPIVEALRAELPMLLSDTAVNREAAGEAALYADPERVDEVAAALARLLDGEFRRTMRSRERSRAELYSEYAVAQRLMDIYTSL